MKVEKRIYGLDILRAVAIMSVLILHSAMCLPAFVYSLIDRYCPDGVSLFFVLSGFLIGGILLKKVNSDHFSLSDFWMRRWLRTLPAYFFIILVLSIISFPGIKSLIKALTFSKYFFKSTESFYVEGWSLNVEEWFYLSIPIVLFICYKLVIVNRKKAFLSVILGVIIIDTILRIIKTSQIDYRVTNVFRYQVGMSTFLRLDSIMYGVLGAYLYHYKFRIWQYKNSLFAIGLGIFLFLEIFSANKSFCYFNYSLLSVGALLLLPKLVSIKSGKGIVFKLITFVSVISYSLYLVNFSSFRLIAYPIIIKYFGAYEGMYAFDLFAFVIFYLWSFGIGYLLYRFIEMPFMKMRDSPQKKNSLAVRIANAPEKPLKTL
jgi:peptidoglycan/LPS O-acetylase OafA/YrhL